MRTEDLSPSSIALLTTQIDFKIRRLGLDSPATFTVSLDPISTNIASVGTPKTFTNMTLLEERIDFIDLELTNGIGVGDKIKFLLNVDNGAYTVSDTITKHMALDKLFFPIICLVIPIGLQVAVGHLPQTTIILHPVHTQILLTETMEIM